MKTVYIIGGTMGVGKSTVCEALQERLENSVVLDGDWCWASNPFRVTDETKNMVIDNICHMMNNFIHCSEYDYIILGWVMHEQSIIDNIISNLDTKNCRVITVSLVCSEEALIRRLKKDIDNNLRTPDIIEKSISRIPLYYKLNTTKIDVSRLSVQECVEELLKLY